MGMVINDLVPVPEATAIQMFDRQGLLRLIRIINSPNDAMEEIRGVLRERHDGDEDFTTVS